MDIYNNPFRILGITPQDNREEILAKSEGRFLETGCDDFQQMGLDLINVKKRLYLEISYLPGLKAEKVEKTICEFENPGLESHFHFYYSPVTRANLISSTLPKVHYSGTKGLSKQIVLLAQAYDEINSKELAEVINRDRRIAGFPPVSDTSSIDELIRDRKVFYRDQVRKVFESLSDERQIQELTDIVEIATYKGVDFVPSLIASLVDSYEVECQVFLQNGKEVILSLIGSINDLVRFGEKEGLIIERVDKLIKLVAKWVTVAKPIQIARKAQGRQHDLSKEIAWLVRDLYVDIFEKLGLANLSKRLSEAMGQVFKDVLEVVERTNKDFLVLKKISENRAKDLFAETIVTIQNICEEELDFAKRKPKKGPYCVNRLMDKIPPLIFDLACEDISFNHLSECQDMLASSIWVCANLYDNAKRDLDGYLYLLEMAFFYSAKGKIREEIREKVLPIREKSLQYMESILKEKNINSRFFSFLERSELIEQKTRYYRGILVNETRMFSDFLQKDSIPNETRISQYFSQKESTPYGVISLKQYCACKNKGYLEFSSSLEKNLFESYVKLPIGKIINDDWRMEYPLLAVLLRKNMDKTPLESEENLRLRKERFNLGRGHFSVW